MRSASVYNHFCALGLICLASVCASSALGSNAAATRPSAAAASQPGSGTSMVIHVVAVKGLVQIRTGDEQPWVTAMPNMILSEGSELRTGPHSSITCVIPPDQTFTLDRLGTVRVQDAVRNGNKVKTDLIMKYGRTHYDIEGAGLEHEATITSPSSTLAVRGTDVVLCDQVPFTPYAISNTGRASFTYGHSTYSVGSKHGSYAKATGGTDGSAGTGLSETVVDPRYAASLTATDAALLATEVARGAVISYNPISGIETVSGGRPSYDSELAATVPGSLDFVLRWTGNANLNLEVGVDPGDPLTNIANGFQKVEFLYPGYGMQNSPSGGHIPYDDLGGPAGGEEIAYWLGSHPTGLYGIGAQFISGVPTSYTFNVFENGQPVEMFYFASDGVTLIKSTQETRTLGPGQFSGSLVLIPDQPLIDQIIPDDPAGNPNPGINPPGVNSASFAPAVHALAIGAKTARQH
ncbi:MAG: hypothetical protein ABSB42_03640 [Tepidisphaeraceae bacterium]|jgi:hypothetical protein